MRRAGGVGERPDVQQSLWNNEALQYRPAAASPPTSAEEGRAGKDETTLLELVYEAGLSGLVLQKATSAAGGAVVLRVAHDQGRGRR